MLKAMSEDQLDHCVPPIERSADDSGDALLPPERSQFSRRLASFGLGETPDPLLTRARPSKPQQADG
jgi:hypothetical protein